MAVDILNTKSMKPIFLDRDFAPMQKALNQMEFGQDDVITVLWGLYNYCLEVIIGQANWRQQFDQAAVRSRFNYSDFNRKALFGQLETLDKVYQKRPFPQEWSEGIEKSKGIFNYVTKQLLRSNQRNISHRARV